MSGDPMEINPFQLGDQVWYVPAGLMAEITGFVWAETVGEPAKLMGYKLDIGIACASASQLRLQEPSQ